MLITHAKVKFHLTGKRRDDESLAYHSFVQVGTKDGQKLLLDAPVYAYLDAVQQVIRFAFPITVEKIEDVVATVSVPGEFMEIAKDRYDVLLVDSDGIPHPLPITIRKGWSAWL